MVHLLRAEYTTTDHPSPYTLTHNLYGEIEVKSSGQDKNVTVHYSLGGDEWYTRNAEFDRMSETSGYEIWTFRLSEPVYKVPPQNFFRFALQYQVNGEEYWDNNNGQDYFGTSF